jgi:chemotaxis protein CheD
MQKLHGTILTDEQESDQIRIIGKKSHRSMGIKVCQPPITRDDLCFTFNKRFNKRYLNIVAGDYFVSNEDIIMGTVLGSCISVCLYSGNSSYCGMNHFMLPERSARFRNEKDIMHTDAAFYGINSMEMLINTLIKVGVNKSMLKAKIFGGGNVLKVRAEDRTVGEQNIDFAVRFLEMEKIPVVSCSIGGDYARKILFFTKNQEVLQWRLGKKVENQIVSEERRLRYEKMEKKDISFF